MLPYPVNAVLEHAECLANTFQMSPTLRVPGSLLTDGRWQCQSGQQAGNPWITHTRNYHTCKRLPAQSWGLEPCGAVCLSLPHLSTSSKHVLGGPRKHCPGQEEAPRAPPSFLPGKQRQRASGWNRHPGTQDAPAPDGKLCISGPTLHVVFSPQ